jgi:hypothetical protein
VADERGAATAELVIATPALLFLLLVVVHVGLWLHATHVASAVAQEGARAARNEGGTELDATATADHLLDQLGGRLIEHPHVEVHIRNGEVEAIVTGEARQVVPFVTLGVRAVSRGPVETFRSPVP